MPYNTINKTAPNVGGFMLFVQRYWPVLLGLISFAVFAVPTLIRYLSSLKARFAVQEQKNDDIKAKADTAKQEAVVKKSVAENKTADIKVQLSKSDQILKSLKTQESKDKMMSAAQRLASDFNTKANIPDYDLRQYFTFYDDYDDAQAVLRYQCKNLKYIEQLYQYVFTKNRNLRSDVLAFLSASDLKKCRDSWKANGVTYV